jgi:hypothetical protein
MYIKNCLQQNLLRLKLCGECTTYVINYGAEINNTDICKIVLTSLSQNQNNRCQWDLHLMYPNN